MTTNGKPRIGKFTRAVIAFGVVAGIFLGLRPMLSETISARLGVRRNTGKRERAPSAEPDSRTALTEQQEFRF